MNFAAWIAQMNGYPMSPNQPSALLVGVDPYAIRACLRNGIKPVVVCPPGMFDNGYIVLPDEVEAIFCEDATNMESALSSLRRSGFADREFAFIQTSHEDVLVVTSVLAKVLGTPGMDPDVALPFRDKWLQKRVVAAAGVDVAMSQILDDIYHPNLAGILDFDKAVLKPIAGAGTMNTSIVHGREELLARCEEYRRSGMPQRTFVLEEFIAGDEWIADGVVFDGNVQFLSISSYAQPCLSVVASNTLLQKEIFDPTADADVYKIAMPVVEAALRALGLRHGVFHMELFRQEQTEKLVFGECAARRGGGVTQELVEHKFGVDLGEAAIRCAAGIDPQIRPSVRPETVGSTFLASRPGILVSHPSPAEIRELPGVEYVRLDLPYGFRMADELSNTVEGAGQVMLSGSTREEFRSRREFLTRWFDERLVVIPAGAANRDLRRWQAGNWPESASSFSGYSRG